MANRILILGARGMLGTQLARLYPTAAAWDREDVDVLDAQAFEGKVRALGNVDAVVNCVAFNDVDGAEDRPEAAFELNGCFVGRLAALCRAIGAALVHYSTNYVFDGVQGEYRESDPPAPLSVYGHSKLRGEELLRGGAERHYVIRTAVLFGPQGPSTVSKRSFVDLMLDLGSKRDTVQAVDDEINSVTYAPDLAAATQRLLESEAPFGTYHLANEGSASWYDLARQIFEFGPSKPRVLPVAGAAFARKAVRPRRAVLLNTKVPALRPWQDALREFVASKKL